MSIGDKSSFFPKQPPDLQDHHQVLHRHGRIISSHTNQLIELDKRVVDLEEASPTQQIRELETRLTEKMSKIDTDVKVEVARIRTALLVAAALLGGGAGAAKIADVLQPPAPINVQVVAPKATD